MYKKSPRKLSLQGLFGAIFALKVAQNQPKVTILNLSYSLQLIRKFDASVVCVISLHPDAYYAS